MVEECIKCGAEALLLTKVHLIEAMRRPTEEAKEAHAKVQEAVGETLHAIKHLAPKYPEIASEIRRFKVAIEHCMFSEAAPQNCLTSANPLPTLDALIQQVIEKAHEPLKPG